MTSTIPRLPMRVERRTYHDADQQQAQERATASVEADAEAHLSAYVADPRSYGGRYVCADLFKETFSDFTASLAARSRMNGPVHNSAALLSAIQFGRAVAPAEPGQRAYLLTGSPGAGKTSLANLAPMPGSIAVVFEGQLSRPASGIEKIQLALDAGLNVTIIAVHSLPEKALENTLTRLKRQGRGASLAVMSDIAGKLPAGLLTIHQRFGRKVALIVHDNRDYNNQRQYLGWQYLEELQSEGNTEAIRARHEDHLNRLWTQHRIDAAAYRQAAEHDPPGR